MKDAQGRTLNKDGSLRKTGSGRKKGATSFTNITLAELQKFCGEATQIQVSRKWLEQVGAVVVEQPAPVVNAAPVIKKEILEETDDTIAFTLHT